MDVPEILRFALDDKMVWYCYYDTASLKVFIGLDFLPYLGIFQVVRS